MGGKAHKYKSFETFTVVMFHVEVYWVVTSCCCGRIPTFRRTMLPPSSSSMVLWNVGILQQHYTASQPRRPWHETSPRNIVVNWKLRDLLSGKGYFHSHGHWHLQFTCVKSTRL